MATITFKIINGTWPPYAGGPYISSDIVKEYPAGDEITWYPSGISANEGWSTKGAYWTPSDPRGQTATGDATFTYHIVTPVYTVTFKIINGTWPPYAGGPYISSDIVKEYPAGDEITWYPSGISANEGWSTKNAQWTPADPRGQTADGNITYTYHIITPMRTITYQIENGNWFYGTSYNNQDVVKEYPDGDTMDWNPSDVRANEGYVTDGRYWTPYNPIGQEATDSETFVLHMVGKPYTVTYRIENGTWADGTDAPKTETVRNGDSPVEMPTGMIPSTGFSSDGAWTPHDPAGYVVTGNISFTFAFEALPLRDFAVLLRIVNGMWDDGSITAKQYTVVEGQSIPAVPTGMMPFEGFGNGYWSSDPSAPIYEDRTFVYTFRRIAPSDEVHYFSLGDVDSIDLGMYIGGQHTYNAPKRDVTKISVPGRNGDLIQDNGRFLNVQVPYNVVVMEQFRERTDELKAWLLSTSKYRKLVDTYHPGTYRLARVGEDIVFNTSAFNLTGKTQVIFDCKPQRFLDEGDEVVEITAGANTIVNPTLFDSEPILKVYVSGGDVNATLRINNAEIELRNVDNYIVINSEIKECYKDSQSRNSHVVLANYQFPTLKPGINSFEFSSGITKIEVTPKWWTI